MYLTKKFSQISLAVPEETEDKQTDTHTPYYFVVLMLKINLRQIPSRLPPPKRREKQVKYRLLKSNKDVTSSLASNLRHSASLVRSLSDNSDIAARCFGSYKNRSFVCRQICLCVIYMHRISIERTC